MLSWLDETKFKVLSNITVLKRQVFFFFWWKGDMLNYFLRFFTAIEFIPLVNFLLSGLSLLSIPIIYHALKPLIFTVFCLLYTLRVSDEG